MKCRRRNKAEELSEGLSAGDSTEATGDLLFHPGAANGLLSGIVGIGNALILGEPQYVALEIAKAFQKTVIGVGQFPLQMRAAHSMVDIVILLVGLPEIVYRHLMLQAQCSQCSFPATRQPVSS